MGRGADSEEKGGKGHLAPCDTLCLSSAVVGEHHGPGPPESNVSCRSSVSTRWVSQVLALATHVYDLSLFAVFRKEHSSLFLLFCVTYAEWNCRACLSALPGGPLCTLGKFAFFFLPLSRLVGEEGEKPRCESHPSVIYLLRDDDVDAGPETW